MEVSPVQNQRPRRLQVGSGPLSAEIAAAAPAEIQLGARDVGVTKDHVGQLRSAIPVPASPAANAGGSGRGDDGR
jgi:hypothetical protein